MGFIHITFLAVDVSPGLVSKWELFLLCNVVEVGIETFIHDR